MKKLVSLSTAVLLFATVCIALVTPAQAAPVSPTPVTIDTSSLDDVRDAYWNVFVPNKNVPSGWAGGSVRSCTPGTTTDAFRTATINTVNYYRALAGLPSVVEEAGATDAAQQTALMMDANDDLSHSPASTWACYTDAGASGAANSNLALTSGAWSGTETLPLWMSDVDIPSVGHRNAILYPPLNRVGVGETTQGSALMWMASSLWTQMPVQRPVFGGVSWPSQNYFPYENVPDSGFWSYSKPGVDFSSTTVTVTKNGTPVSGITYGERTNWGRGYTPDSHIVWKMPTVTEPAAGVTDVYHVTISGIGSYDVKVFSATATPVTPAVTVATVLITGTPTVGNILTASVGPVSPADAAKTYQWYRNGTAIAGATNATYTVAAADVGQTITVNVAVSKSGFRSSNRTSTGVDVYTAGRAGNSEWYIASGGPLTVGAGPANHYEVGIAVRDEFNNEVEGAVVTIKSLPSVEFLGGPTCTTDSTGQCWIRPYSTVAGTFELSAWLGSEQIGTPQSVAWTPDVVCAVASGCTPDPSVDAAHTTRVVATTNNAAADGVQRDVATAYAFDQYGNPVPGAVISSDKVDRRGTLTTQPDRIQTDSSGEATIWYTSTVVGRHDAWVTVDGNVPANGRDDTGWVTLTFGPGRVDPDLSRLSDPTIQVAGSPIVLTLAIQDSNRNPVTGLRASQVVVTGVSHTAGVPDSSLEVTDFVETGNGGYTYSLTSKLAGTFALSATVDGVLLNQQTFFTYIAGPVCVVGCTPVDPTHVTRVVMDVNDQLANGTDANTATAYAYDQYGNPVQGATVVTTDESTGALAGKITPANQTKVTGADGTATLSWTSRAAGSFAAGTTIDSVKPAIGGVLSGVSGIRFSNGSLDPSRSTLVVTPAGPRIAGDSYTALATIIDLAGDPVVGETVNFTTNSFNATLSAATCSTNTFGQCTVTFSSKLAGTYQLSATVPVAGVQRNISGAPASREFVAGEVCVVGCTPVDPTHVTQAVVTKDAAQANSPDQNQVTLNAYDRFGNPVQGAPVATSTSDSSLIRVNPTATTLADGTAVLSYTSTSVGAKTAEITVDGKTPLGSPVTLHFRSATPDPDQSALSVHPTTQEVDKNVTATAVIKDALGYAMPGTTVTFSVSGDATLSSVTATTDASGQATVTLTNTKAEIVNVTATIRIGSDDKEISGSPAQVVFTPGALCIDTCVPGPDVPNDRRTRIDVVEDDALADGQDTNELIVWAFDKYGNPIPDIVVETTQADPVLRVAVLTKLTGSDGSASITYLATAGGSHQASVTLNGVAIIFTPQPGSDLDNPTDKSAHSSPATLAFQAISPQVKTGGWVSVRAFQR